MKQVVYGNRWSRETGGLWRDIFPKDRWSLETSGLWRKVISKSNWFMETGGLWRQDGATWKTQKLHGDTPWFQ